MTFNSYQRSYNKEQKAYRFAIFIQNVKEFNDEEKRNPGLDLDVTQFADWTEEEMKNLLSNGYGDHHSLEISRFKDTVIREGDKRPMEINWRMLGKVTEVKNQMQCGSCWAFATVAAVESQYAIRRNQLITLSEQEMLDCDSKNNGCHGGYRPYAMKFVQRSGLVKDAEYPYNGKEGNTCKLSNMTQQRVYINDYQILSSNENLIADWIATNGPVTFGSILSLSLAIIDLISDGTRLDYYLFTTQLYPFNQGMNVTKAMYSYRNGIFTPSPEDCQNNSLGSHALTIVGYGTEEQRDFWLVKNSWGGRWGQEGYFKLARGVNSCGVANIVVAPVIN
uniref:Papain family cysteine protease n=1 Tax=Heterorhabditis bacteriophora TaxID=37862 RepID=A0A1I7X5Y8_HETBA